MNQELDRTLEPFEFDPFESEDCDSDFQRWQDEVMAQEPDPEEKDENRNNRPEF